MCKIALSKLLKDDTPKKKNATSLSAMRITENGDIDFNIERKMWVSLIEEYENLLEIEIVHPFFGKDAKDQIGIMTYKHIDHHLRQFGV